MSFSCLPFSCLPFSCLSFSCLPFSCLITADRKMTDRKMSRPGGRLLYISPSPLNLRQRRLQFAVPGRAVFFDQHLRRLAVADDLFLRVVPPNHAADFHRDVGQVAGDRSLVSAFYIRDRLLARFYAIEKITHVGNELVAHLFISVFLHRFSERLRRGWRPSRLGEARNLILGRDLRIRKDFKTAAFEPQRPLRPKKFQTPAATRRADLAV